MNSLRLINQAASVANIRIMVFIIASVLVTSASANNKETDIKLRLLINEHQLTGKPAAHINIPDPESQLSQLGRDLFFFMDFGGQNDVACASCHHPFLGGGDNLSLSVGVNAEQVDVLGQGRIHNWQGKGAIDPKSDGRPNVPRNSPTIFNASLYKKQLFHDGRISTIIENNKLLGIKTPDSFFGAPDINAGADLLSAQSRFPIVSINEMRGYETPSYVTNDEIRSKLEVEFLAKDKKLTNNYWLKRFRVAFNKHKAPAGELLNFKYFSKAIAEYEKSMVLVNTPWSKYVTGDKTAISESAKQGAILFYSSLDKGGAECVACHRGDFFTDEEFHNLAMPQIGRGVNKHANDYGRERVTRNVKDKYAFRTPSLLNIAVTGPYAHAGSYSTLTEVIKHHIDVEQAVLSYDYTLNRLPQFNNNIKQSKLAKKNTLAALDKIMRSRVSGEKHIKDVVLTKVQIRNIVDFLLSLTDPCVENRQCLKKWIPDYNTKPTNIKLLEAKFKNESLLTQSPFKVSR